MSDELRAVKEVVTHPAAGGTALFAVIGWLANKVWRGHRHEVASMKAAAVNNSEAIRIMDDKFEAHVQRDHDIHTQIMEKMSENHKEILEHLINLKR